MNSISVNQNATARTVEQDATAQAILRALAARVGDDCFARWFDAKVMLSWNNGELTVRSLSRFASDMIRRRFRDDLLIVGQQVTGDVPSLVFITSQQNLVQTDSTHSIHQSNKTIVDTIVTPLPLENSVEQEPFFTQNADITRDERPISPRLVESVESMIGHDKPTEENDFLGRSFSETARSERTTLAPSKKSASEKLEKSSLVTSEMVSNDTTVSIQANRRKKQTVARKRTVKRTASKKAVSVSSVTCITSTAPNATNLSAAAPDGSHTRKRIQSAKRQLSATSTKPVVSAQSTTPTVLIASENTAVSQDPVVPGDFGLLPILADSTEDSIEALVANERTTSEVHSETRGTVTKKIATISKKGTSSRKTSVSKKAVRKVAKRAVPPSKTAMIQTTRKAARNVLAPQSDTNAENMFKAVENAPRMAENELWTQRNSPIRKKIASRPLFTEMTDVRNTDDTPDTAGISDIADVQDAQDTSDVLVSKRTRLSNMSKRSPRSTVVNRIENANVVSERSAESVSLRLASDRELDACDELSIGGDDTRSESQVRKDATRVESSTLQVESTASKSSRSTSVSNATTEDVLRANRYTLATFKWSDHNGIAKETSRTIIEYPGQYSPCLFYGSTGVGKTHLVRALLHEHKRRHPRGTAIYMTSEQFTSDYVAAASGGGFPSFRRKYRSCDFFVLEDLQFFLDGKTSTQVELYHTVDTLLQSQKQVLFTADRPIPEMQQLDARLLARIQGGMICLLSMPGYATRLEILRQQNREQAGRRNGNTLWGDSVLQRIAARVTTQVRELFGALNRLEAFQRVNGQPLTDHEIDEALDELAQENNRAIRLADVAHAVCATFGLDDSGLQSESRTKRFSEPRMLAMWLARKYTRAALTEIGAFFGGRKHSTVISAQKRVENWIEDGQTLSFSDTPLRVEEAIRRIEEYLRAS